ncbi:hypothetical protein PR001_g21286 [Phytophthora rubi]|uniref:Integrase catalytic domain-containing protein n=1 Tax=Phytophthora rubi TaxID=129364 RepID=A0A6A3JGQ9_9STRA|nr:hypothetical protein PR001_g21286 [Phytophthora rubi]
MAYCPWANGTVEVVNRLLLKLLRAVLSEPPPPVQVGTSARMGAISTKPTAIGQTWWSGSPYCIHRTTSNHPTRSGFFGRSRGGNERRSAATQSRTAFGSDGRSAGSYAP